MPFLNLCKEKSLGNEERVKTVLFNENCLLKFSLIKVCENLRPLIIFQKIFTKFLNTLCTILYSELAALLFKFDLNFRFLLYLKYFLLNFIKILRKYLLKFLKLRENIQNFD